MRKLIPEEIKEYISYNPDTGDLLWIKRLSNRVKIGDAASNIDNKGYLRIGFMCNKYPAHRVAWYLQTGEQPPSEIDHVDGNKLNNTFTNLREATHSENMCNKGKRSDNTSGFKGVCWHRVSSKWLSQIKLNGKNQHLGLFTSPEEAHQAYCKAADDLHKQFANKGEVT